MLAGNVQPLIEYIQNVDFVTKCPAMDLTAEGWADALPSWKGRDKKRGLKSWKSNTARGRWDVSGMCARVVNEAVRVYMLAVAVPPVVEGVKKAGEAVYTIKTGGLDLLSPFIMTVHRAYCNLLKPEVEEGLVAYTRVLQYMLTRPVRVKLLRAVRSVFRARAS